MCHSNHSSPGHISSCRLGTGQGQSPGGSGWESFAGGHTADPQHVGDSGSRMGMQGALTANLPCQ